jgi:hypothetical protein
VFGWTVIFGKAAVSCVLWKSCCEKAAVGKAEDRLVKAAVSCGKLCAVAEIPVISLKVCGTVYKPKYSYKHNMFTISHVNVSFEKKNIKFSKFFIHMGGVGAAVGSGGIGQRGAARRRKALGGRRRGSAAPDPGAFTQKQFSP